MAFKTKVRNHVREGKIITVQHMNGYEYTGKVMSLDLTNASDISLVLKDEEGDQFIMAVTAEMGVICIPENEQVEEEIPHGKPDRLSHEPKDRTKKITTVKQDKKKKSTNKNFNDIHAPRDRKITRQ